MAFVLEPDVNVSSACEPLKFFYIPAELLRQPWRSLVVACVGEILADGIGGDIVVHPIGQHSV
jgi:hypothetical protein